MQDQDDPRPLDPYRDILGIDLPPERLAENLRLYEEILREVKKLRSLDLTETHPAIVFDPTLGYDEDGEP